MLYKVLIVDDDKEVRDLLSGVLIKEDCVSVTCESGEEALETLKKEAFDVVLLDIKLFDMSGLDVLKAIREKYGNLPVVMITGFGFDEELLSRSKQFGCSGYIGKFMPVVQIVLTLLQIVKDTKKNTLPHEQ